MTDQEIIQLLFDTGHLTHPFGESAGAVPQSAVDSDLTHPVIERAMASYHDLRPRSNETTVLADSLSSVSVHRKPISA